MILFHRVERSNSIEYEFSILVANFRLVLVTWFVEAGLPACNILLLLIIPTGPLSLAAAMQEPKARQRFSY